MIEKFVSDESDIRVDKWILQNFTKISRTLIKKLSDEGKLSINGKVSKCGQKLKIGDEIEIDIPPPRDIDVVAQDIPIFVVYEDEDIIVVNKPTGMVVHPAAGNYEGTLVNALISKYRNRLSSINGVIRPGIVHRIDKDTSGLLVIARNNFSHEKLSNLFKNHDIVREYYAIVDGVIKEEKGKIDAPISRDINDRKKMAVNPNKGRRAVTFYNVIERLNKSTLIKVTLETGRTHQIRVHMSYIGFPVAGDPVYGRKNGILKQTGQLLHAKKLGFVHPSKGNYIEFDSDLPENFQNALDKLRLKS